MRYFKIPTILLLLLLISPASGSYCLDSSPSETHQLFESDETLQIVLRTDLKMLLRTKKDGEYQEGEITMYGKTYPIRLKARGNYRRENCYFPPVTLNFSKTEFEDPSFQQLEKLKLVNACKMQKDYEQYILREYLIYRTFNLLTDKSFKVRLLQIDYQDTKGKMDPLTRYGFVIEDQYMMARRLDGVIIKKTGIRDLATQRDQMVMLSVFQFMMGNTDWNVPRLHNLKLLKLNEVTETAPYVVPYDFDYTGMVNASYAIPSDILGIKSIRERLYWGKCYTKEEFEKAIQLFMNKKEDIYQLYQNYSLFSKSSQSMSLDYLDSFYSIIENPKKWKYYFLDNCKQ